jgi:prepilin-type N-terminal cleavage/methylation domain-containing protein
VKGARGFSLVELLAVLCLLTILAALVVIPAYFNYSRAREVGDAAAILAQDIAYLERFAQDSAPYEGATIEVESDDPLSYTCYSGRPSSLDPQSYIRDALQHRVFNNVALTPGALSAISPLLFARNGSVQYVTGGQWNNQHVPVSIELSSTLDPSRTSIVGLNPFTGAVSSATP